jgi:hypothetical protein
MKVSQVFSCAVCETEYRTSQEAQECEARAAAAKPSVNVGDIVFANAGFGWYDGAREWVANADAVEREPKDWKAGGKSGARKCPNGDGNCFGPCCTFQFYYVVTYIDSDDFNDDTRRAHRPRYHLVTAAMTGGYHAGYTFDKGHYTPKIVAKPPQYVVRTSKALIGQKATHLL